MDKISRCVISYEKLKNLKLVSKDTGIPWQTVYVYLKSAGVQVVGDKARYGSVTDRLAAYAEGLFKLDVPEAIDNNNSKYQATVDFYINNSSIDVKASMLSPCGVQSSGKSYAARWAYCISKQKDVADYFVLYAFDGHSDSKPILKHVFLIPKEIATTKASISIPETLSSKWADYKVDQGELNEFFMAISKMAG